MRITYESVQRKLLKHNILFELTVPINNLPYRLQAKFTAAKTFNNKEDAIVKISVDPELNIMSSSLNVHPNYIAELVWEKLKTHPIEVKVVPLNNSGRVEILYYGVKHNRIRGRSLIDA